MKKIISIALAAVIAAFSVIPVFAESISTQKSELDSLVRYMERVYVYRFYQIPLQVPMYSDASNERMKSAIATIRSEMDTYTTDEEFNEATNLLYSCKSQMYVDRDELEFMLNLMKNDYEDTEFYNDVTSAEIKDVYDNAKNAFENGTEQDIHIAYIEMRNELNKICLTITVPGDANNDGVFNVKDTTLIQKYLVDSEKLTSAQCFAAGINKKNNNIIHVTNLQKSLTDIENDDLTATESIAKNMSKLENDYYVYPIDIEYFSPVSEHLNELFFMNRYYKNYV